MTVATSLSTNLTQAFVHSCKYSCRNVSCWSILPGLELTGNLISCCRTFSPITWTMASSVSLNKGTKKTVDDPVCFFSCGINA